jgi:hypothetical protein
MSWGLHRRLQNIFQFTVPVSGSAFSGSQAVFTEVSGTTARFANYTGPTGGQATFTSASISSLIATGSFIGTSRATGSLFGTASYADRAMSSSHAIRSDSTTINYVQSILTASVDITPNNNQFITFLRLTIPSGTWMVNAIASAGSTVQNDIFVRLNTGSIMFASQGQSAGHSSFQPYAAGFSLSFPLVATESINLTFEGAWRGTGAAAKILANLGDSFDFFSGGNTFPNNGNTATMITAYRIG